MTTIFRYHYARKISKIKPH